MAKRFLPAGLFFIATACIALVAVGPLLAGPTVTVGANVPEGRRVKIDAVDHSTWDSLLKKYVDDKGMVDYRAWKASAQDQLLLDRYLKHLSAATFPQGSSRDAQLAFWINAYNAVTVKGILREYPTTSIRNHTAKVFGYNIWKDLVLPVEGKTYSLDAMEHQVLRKIGEPQIHFAIVCASIGCPRLLNEAYTAQKLQSQLAANTQAFFADRTKFAYDASRKTIWLSPILQWFGEDFGRDQAEQLRTIAPYLLDKTSRQLAGGGRARIIFLDYDWGLNDQATTGNAARR